MTFEWDDLKTGTNFREHGIDFADAVAVFHDQLAVTIPEVHPDEERWATIGMDLLGRILAVVYSWRGDTIRLISARHATRRERLQTEALR